MVFRRRLQTDQEIAPAVPPPNREERERQRTLGESLFLNELAVGKSFPAALRRSGSDWADIQERLVTSPEFAIRCLETQDRRTVARALRLASLADDAIAVLEQAIADGDRHVALELLKELAVLKSTSTESPLLPPDQVQDHRRPAPRLLLIEDEAPVRRLIVKYFSAVGFSVDEASSAEEALLAGPLADVYAVRPRIDCLLLDVHLPGLSGIQLARIVQDAWPKTPVVFITGDPEGATAADLRQSAPAELLAKPFDLAELHAAVARTVNLRGRSIAAPGTDHTL